MSRDVIMELQEQNTKTNPPQESNSIKADGIDIDISNSLYRIVQIIRTGKLYCIFIEQSQTVPLRQCTTVLDLQCSVQKTVNCTAVYSSLGFVMQCLVDSSQYCSVQLFGLCTVVYSSQFIVLQCTEVLFFLMQFTLDSFCTKIYSSFGFVLLKCTVDSSLYCSPEVWSLY